MQITKQAWGTRSASYWMVMLVAAGISFIGIRYMLVPHAGGEGFGIPLPYDKTQYYGVIKGMRDLFSGLVLAYLLWIRDQRSTLVIFSFATLIPIVDGYTILRVNGIGDVAHLSIHWGTALYALITIAVLYAEIRKEHAKSL